MKMLLWKAFTYEKLHKRGNIFFIVLILVTFLCQTYSCVAFILNNCLKFFPIIIHTN